MRIVFLLIVCVIVSAQIMAQDWESTFWDLYDEGDTYYYAFNYRSALEVFEESYLIAEEHLSSNEIYEAIFAIVLTNEKLQNADELNEVIRNGLNKYGTKFKDIQKSRLYRYLAIASRFTSEFISSISYSDTAYSYAISAKDTIYQGRLLVDKAIDIIYLGNYQKALNLLDEAKKLNIEEARFLSSLNLNIFIAYNYLDKEEVGVQYLKEAYKYAQESNNTAAYIDVLTALSNYTINQNNFREGLLYLNEGMALAKKTNDLPAIARFSDNYARIFNILGEKELAITYYNEAITIYEQQGNNRLVNRLKIQIASLFISLNEPELAREILEELLDLELDSLNRVLVYEYLSVIEMEISNYVGAKEYLDIIRLQLRPDNELLRNRINGRYLNLPNISAEEKLELAKQNFVGSNQRSTKAKMNAEFDLARAFEPIEPDSAFKYAYRALNRLEERRVSTSASSIKNQINRSWQTNYYMVADWEITHNNDFNQAFEFFELSKSRALFDQIFENQQAELLDPENPNSIKVLELQKRVDQLYQQLARDQLSEEYQSDMLEISELEIELQTEMDALISSNSELQNLEYPSVSSLSEAQDLLDNETAYLSYGIRNDQLILFLTTKEEEFFKSVVVGKNARDSLGVLTNNFRDAIINMDEINALQKYSNDILTYIFDPIIEELENINHLIISPDGPLHLLPFESLILDNQYLIERFSVKYVPSISVYDVINYAKINEFDKELLAVAGSGFESNDGFFGSSSQSAFSTLPYSLAEVDSINNYFSNSTILKNEEVTEFSFKNLSLSDYRFVHMATHGNIDERLPDQSGLILSKKMGTESLFGEDGYLNAREISQLDIPAELVVLSACNTGTGKVINGEGVMGLQRSMLVAGASSVVVSLWNIFDRSTPLFMNTFYKYLLEFEEEEVSFFDKIKMYANIYEPDLIDYKTLALQQAKIEMINHPYYDHPVHWAPFILTGK